MRSAFLVGVLVLAPAGTNRATVPDTAVLDHCDPRTVFSKEEREAIRQELDRAEDLVRQALAALEEGADPPLTVAQIADLLDRAGRQFRMACMNTRAALRTRCRDRAGSP